MNVSEYKKRIKKDHPYMYQFLYEQRMNLLVFKYKTNNENRIIRNISRIYKKRIGHTPNIQHPKFYTEKIQWRKLYDRNPQYSVLSDKYLSREWAKERIGNEYIIPLLGVWDRFEEIPFNDLPNSFVIKINNSSGTNIIVKDKSLLDLRLIKKKIDYWLSFQYWYAFGYEMQYKSIVPKIIAEQYICNQSGDDDLKDYKFLCFDGKVLYVWVDTGRFNDHKRYVFDAEWNRVPFNQMYPIQKDIVEKPENFDKMIEIAEILSKDFDHVRVDLYNNDGKIYFGEMTFTNGSGFEPIIPKEWDLKLGKKWTIKNGK